MALTMLAASTEYASATVTANKDITGDAIQLSFPVKGDQPSVWTTATVLGVVPNSGTWTATYQILIGPASGDVSFTVGTYDAYVKITDSPEVPVRKFDTLLIQ